MHMRTGAPVLFFTPNKRMKNILYLTMTLTCALLLGACGGSDDSGEGQRPEQVTNSNANDNSAIKELSRLEFPKVRTDGSSIVIIHHTDDSYGPDGVNYSVEWDTSKKSQRWSCYEMYNGFGGNAGYYGTFEEDPDVPVAARFSNTNEMYSGSGFTRGHICPSADRQYSKEANHQTFYYTNMQPQYYNFNAGKDYTGIWVRLENQIRTWAKHSTYTNGRSTPDTLYVVKGGTIDGENKILMRIKGSLIVPRYFFMAVLCKNTMGYKAIGFWMEHTQNGSPELSIADVAVNIDELEERTGIDFFCNLPDATEEAVESLPRQQVLKAWGLQ